eukprot:9956174-Ditylum_brightwellii.AAC.1
MHLCIYWAGRKAPFIDDSFPQMVGANLKDVVKGELKRKRPNANIVIDRDLKLAKSESGTNVECLFDFPTSTSFTAKKDDNPNGLHI